MSVCVKKKDKTCVHSICVQKIVGLDNHTTICIYEIYLSMEKVLFKPQWNEVNRLALKLGTSMLK